MYEKKGASVLYLASPTRNKEFEVEMKPNDRVTQAARNTPYYRLYGD